MGFRIEVGADEPIVDALKRLRQLIKASGGLPLGHYRWHKKRYDFYLKPSVYRRRKSWITQRCRRRGRPMPISADPDYQWVEDLFLRPARAWTEAARQRRQRPRPRHSPDDSGFPRHPDW